MSGKPVAAQDLLWHLGEKFHLEPHQVDGYQVGHAPQDVIVDAACLTGDAYVIVDYHAGSIIGRTVYEAGTEIIPGRAA